MNVQDYYAILIAKGHVDVPDTFMTDNVIGQLESVGGCAVAKKFGSTSPIYCIIMTKQPNGGAECLK